MEKKSIAELKELFDQKQFTDELVRELKHDQRKGVQTLLKRYERQQQKEQTLKDEFIKMTVYEQSAWKNGFNLIAGVDEAGRGPLAGPIVAAAVILPADFKLYGLNDSKKLNEKQRNFFYEKIKSEAIAWKVSVVTNQQIDEMNIFQATKLAMTNALNQLKQQPDYALIDAVQLSDLPYQTKEIIKGDEKSISIAAASILAKVTRDQLMKEIHTKFPCYDFQSNMGYGTKYHMEQLKKHGVSPYHRRSFAPVKAALKV